MSSSSCSSSSSRSGWPGLLTMTIPPDCSAVHILMMGAIPMVVPWKYTPLRERNQRSLHHMSALLQSKGPQFSSTGGNISTRPVCQITSCVIKTVDWESTALEDTVMVYARSQHISVECVSKVAGKSNLFLVKQNNVCWSWKINTAGAPLGLAQKNSKWQSYYRTSYLILLGINKPQCIFFQNLCFQWFWNKIVPFKSSYAFWMCTPQYQTYLISWALSWGFWGSSLTFLQSRNSCRVVKGSWVIGHLSTSLHTSRPTRATRIFRAR